MKKKIGIILSTILILALAIGGYFIHKKASIPFTDKEILDFAYPGTKKLDEFYTKDYENGSIYYENTVSVYSISINTAPMRTLCTDDREEALNWSNISNENSSQQREITGERETEKYFEFQRVYEKHTLLSRVHKCSYLDRTKSEPIPGMIDKIDYSEKGVGIYLGNFNKRPITLEGVNELIPYLRHSFIVYNNNQVIGSSVQEKSSEIEYTIYEIHKNIGDFNIPDTITLMKSKYIVNKESGEIHLFIGGLRRITGH